MLNQLGFWTSKISNKRDGGLLKNSDAQTQSDAIKIVRGSSEKYSTEAVELSKRVREWLDKFKLYYILKGD